MILKKKNQSYQSYHYFKKVYIELKYINLNINLSNIQKLFTKKTYIKYRILKKKGGIKYKSIYINKGDRKESRKSSKEKGFKRLFENLVVLVVIVAKEIIMQGKIEHIH